ncbi:MAG: diguanylate cyclase, partial [Firmicutes bacterium]|nr:diguanylate cyclase [Bacillota bacterium]
VLDQNKKIIAWNRAIEEMSGAPKEEMIGRGDFAYSVPFYGEPRPVLIDLIFSANSQIEGLYDYVDRKGDTLFAEVFVPSLNKNDGGYIWVKASPLIDRDSNFVGAICSIRDITQRKEIEERLKYLSLHDSLTGLHNRAYFEEEMRRLEGGHSYPVSIILCDVDGLKLVNDSLGHRAGDTLLIAAADVNRRSFNSGVKVSRIGGDEFAILLPGANRAGVESYCARMRENVKVYNEANPDLPLSLSIGFATASDYSVSLGQVFKEADNNMYREKLYHSQSARSVIVSTLMKALEARDFITEGHADRIQDLVEDMALVMGLSERKANELRLFAQFHDIGKVGIPDRILFKAGPLTGEEYNEMKRHCEIGYRIAQSAPDLASIADWILKHHEWWNGHGYPLKLKGDEIPLECRILSIADAYDAMTSDRPYRKALPKGEALAELERFAEVQFDPVLVKVFIELLEGQ